jgi:hypothetical protein
MAETQAKLGLKIVKCRGRHARLTGRDTDAAVELAKRPVRSGDAKLLSEDSNDAVYGIFG